MARVDLDAPLSHKDEAKSLGARWDPQAKVWYVPDGKEVGLLARWLPLPNDSDLEHEPEFLIRSPYYYVVESNSGCWNCNSHTRVFAFMLPESHEEFELVVDEDEVEFTLEKNLGYWKSHGIRGTVSGIHRMSPQVLHQVRLLTEHYKLAYSKAAGSRYYMNHCEYCGVKLGDFFMHSEPGGAFFPTSPTQASKQDDPSENQ
jgi:hypothetical protein